MTEKLILAWIVTIIGFGISIYFIIRSIVFSRSLLREVPYVPVNKRVGLEALKLLKLKEGDNFVDIGSGNGFIVIEAANTLEGKGTFTGIEISGWLVFVSRLRKFLNRYKENVQFVMNDMLKQDYSKMNKVFMFLTTDMIKMLIPKLEKELPKGSLIVSVLFPFGENFNKTHNIEVKECKMWGKTVNLYLWRK